MYKLKMRILTLFLLMLAIKTVSVYGQQEPSYTQYMYNMFLTNPAAAGSDGSTSVSFTGREQWIGFPGAPKTHSLSAQTRVLKNSFIAKALNLRKKFSRRSSSGRIGAGAHIFSDINGPVMRTGLHLTYAYHITIRQSQLSFGLTMMPYQFNTINSFFKNYDTNDPLMINLKPRYVIDGNFGMLYTTPEYFGGLSVTNLFESNIKFGDNSTAGYQILRHYCIMGGYKFPVNRYITIEPTSLIKFTEMGSFQMDITGRVFYRDDYWGGLGYRTGANAGAISLLAGIRLKKYYFGYAFDLSLSPIQQYSYGSHEFIFMLKFGENARRYRWLNRY